MSLSVLKQKILLQCEKADSSRDKLLKVLDMKASGYFKRSLSELLKNAYLEYTIPENPGSRLQKYRLTEKGDIVFDGFCCTGMTDVAAQMLNLKAILSDLSSTARFIAHNYNSKVDVADFENEARRISEDSDRAQIVLDATVVLLTDKFIEYLYNKNIRFIVYNSINEVI